MSPSAFRDLPRQDQIEMMAHRREENWRKTHSAHIEEKIRKAEADANKPPGR